MVESNLWEQSPASPSVIPDVVISELRGSISSRSITPSRSESFMHGLTEDSEPELVVKLYAEVVLIHT